MSGSQVVLVVAVVWVAIGITLSLVLGRRGHNGFGWLVLGTVLGPLAVALALSSLGNTERPGTKVLAASPRPEGGLVDVLVGFDGSDESAAALHAAVDLLGSRIGRLTLATVVPYDVGREEERDAVARLDAEGERLAWLAPGREVLRGQPAAALTARAAEEGYELLAAGTRGAGKAHLFGSAATGLARTSKIPVLLVGPGSPGQR